MARAVAAIAPDLPVVAVAGVCSLTPGQLRSAGIARAYALADIEPDLTRCPATPGPLLEYLAAAFRPRLARAVTETSRRESPTAGDGAAILGSLTGGELTASRPGRNPQAVSAPAAPEEIHPEPRGRRRVWPTALVVAAYGGISAWYE